MQSFTIKPHLRVNSCHLQSKRNSVVRASVTAHDSMVPAAWLLFKESIAWNVKYLVKQLLNDKTLHCKTSYQMDCFSDTVFVKIEKNILEWGQLLSCQPQKFQGQRTSERRRIWNLKRDLLQCSALIRDKVCSTWTRLRKFYLLLTRQHHF